jgi:hypothetical protein
MELIAKIVSVGLLLFLSWQIIGSVWNIVAIVLQLVRDK